MAIRQLSVFVENKPCKLMETTRLLADAGINLRAMSIADTKDFGILRLIVSDTEKAREALYDDLLVTVTDVVAAKMKDECGSLCAILEALSDAGVNIDYMYAFPTPAKPGAYVVFRVDDNDAAEQALARKGIVTLCQADMADI